MTQSAADAAAETSVALAAVAPAAGPAAGADPNRSRRDVLAAAAGALVGLLGSRLAAPEAAAAANGGSFILGQENSASAVTSLTASNEALKVTTTSTSGIGLVGMASSTAAATNGNTNYGVFAAAFGPAGVGVKGIAPRNGTGVVGQSYASGVGNTTHQLKTGVYGYAAQDTGAIGVSGESTVGLGVKGKAATGTGVYGTTASGYGVLGFGGTGVGGYFQTGGAMVGVALQAVGRVKFDKSVGRATIAAGARSVTVTPGIDLTATAAVVATLQGAAGGALVERVSVDTTANTFTIWLTKATTVAAPVAWHVFG